MKSGKSNRFDGLDAIRFVCAMFVLITHVGIPPVPNPFPEGTWLHLGFRGVLGNVFSGPAAVIVFFLVSGFCIHHPFIDPSRPLNRAAFYARRGIRISLPAACGIAAGWVADAALPKVLEPVLWSLVAELIYYALYPWLRAARFRFGSWRPLLIASYVGAFLVVLTHPRAVHYHSYGSGLNWLLGLPCWLLGCVLAERADEGWASPPSRLRVWLLRGTVLAAASLCSALRFHSPMGYPWTLNLFALLVWVWLEAELGFRLKTPAPAWLERAGAWSYSLYLMHLPFQSMLARGELFQGAGLGSWGMRAGALLVLSYLFFRCVEAPSHRLAIRLGQQIGQSRPVVGAAAS